jgi:SAM-dependent methyltransferase
VTITTTASPWTDLLAAEEWPDRILVVGETAGEAVRGLQLDGSPPIAAEGEALAVLSSSDAPDLAGDLSGIPAGSFDAALLLWAWSDPGSLGEVLAEAHRVLAPGGAVVAAEPDVEALTESSAIRYPARLQFTGRPEAAEAARASVAGRIRLAAETARARFVPVRIHDLDVVLGRYDTAEEYWEAVGEGAWRSLHLLPQAEAEMLIERAAGELGRVAPLGPVVDRRPWLAATGTKR